MNTETSAEKIAKILRTDKDNILAVENVLTETVGHNSVLDKIVEENEKIMGEKLELLEMKLKEGVGAYDKPLGAWVYGALLDKIKKDDQILSEILNYPVCITPERCQTLFSTAYKTCGCEKGFFLKIEKAKEFLTNTPPKNIVKSLGYKNIESLLEKEDIFEIYSALRFMEDGDWLNNVFFKQYENLTPDDFEEREIKGIALSDKWKGVAEKFLKKKYHNISHLKELGVIFILPAVLGIPGETLRTLALILHYFHEIDFYSKIFKKFAKENESFANKLVSSLRGDVLDKRFEEKTLGKKWMIVQQYLAKHDENDWRLFEPHVNPEAIHWRKAEEDIGKLGKSFGNVDLSFWADLDFVGDYFPTESGIDVLVSFNLVDTAMSLVKKKEMIKYLYHHQEALWNKIFAGFLGEEKMEEMIIQNFEKGFIEL